MQGFFSFSRADCMGPGYMATSPICVIDPSSGIPGDCTACASRQECIEAFGARAPFCAPTGACVPCLANANCPDMDNAFCDVGATFMCVPCRADQREEYTAYNRFKLFQT